MVKLGVCLFMVARPDFGSIDSKSLSHLMYQFCICSWFLRPSSARVDDSLRYEKKENIQLEIDGGRAFLSQSAASDHSEISTKSIIFSPPPNSQNDIKGQPQGESLLHRILSTIPLFD